MNKRILSLLLALLMTAQLVLPAGAEAFDAEPEGQTVSEETSQAEEAATEEVPEAPETQTPEDSTEESTGEATEAPTEEVTEAPVTEPEEEATEAPQEPETVVQEEIVEDIADAHAAESEESIDPNTECGPDLKWSLDSNGVLTISGDGYMLSYSEKEPAPWADKTVTKLVVEEGVTGIGSYAFYNQTELAGELIFPKSLSYIGEYAFAGCQKITGLSIHFSYDGESGTQIDQTAFSEPDGHGFVFHFYGTPDGWRSAVSDSWMSYWDVHYLTEDGAERCGDNLTWTLVDGTLTISGTGTMWGTDRESMGYRPLWKNSTITKLVLEEGVTSIGPNAFSRDWEFEDARSCLDLEDKTLVLPKSLHTISENAFQGSTSSIQIIKMYYSPRWNWDEGRGIYIEDGAFDNDDYDNPHVVYFYGGNPNLWNNVKDGLQSFGVVYYTEDGQHRCGDDLTWTFEDGTLTISGTGPMWGDDYDTYYSPEWKHYNITKLVLEEGITSICKYAFSRDWEMDNDSCLNLADGTLVLPKSLRNISEGAFQGSTSSIQIIKMYYSPRWNWDEGRGIYIEDGAFDNDDYDNPHVVYFYGGNPNLWNNVKDGLQSFGVVYYTEDGQKRCGDNLTWAMENGTLTISGTGSMWADDFTAPWRVDKITQLVLSDDLTAIAPYAFGKYDDVEGDGLNLMSSKLVLPKKLGHIADCAFYGAKNLTTLELFDGLRFIGDNAFDNCENLKEIIFHGTQQQWADITGSSFADGLTITCLADNTGSCGEGLRWQLNVYGKLTISGTGAMTDYGKGEAPWAKRTVKKLVLGDGVTSIGDYAFADCDITGSVRLPQNLADIGKSAFAGCSGITSLEVYRDLRTINASAFAGCSGIAGVYYHGTQAQWARVTLESGNGALTNLHYFGEGSDIGLCGDNLVWKLDADGTLTVSGTGDMWENADLPDGGRITRLVLEEGMTSIGDNTFNGLTLTERVVIPKSVTTIGTYTFRKDYDQDETGLREIEIFDTVKKIGESAFEGQNQLKIYFHGTPDQWDRVTSQYYSCEMHYVAENGERCGDDLIWTLDADGTLTVTGTGDMWDADYYKPTEDAVVKKLVLDDRITHISSSAFQTPASYEHKTGKLEIETLVLPKSLKSIGYGAFEQCETLQTVEMYGAVESIDFSAFSNCKNLKAINFHGTPSQWENMDKDLPYSVKVHYVADQGEPCGDDLVWTLEGGTLTITGTGAMWDNYYPWAGQKVTELKLDDRITYIGSSAFSHYNSGGESMTLSGTLVLPKNLEGIGSSAFEGLGIKRVEVFDSLKWIDYSPFGDSLADVYYHGTRTQWDQIDTEYKYSGWSGAQIHYLAADGEMCGDDLVWTLKDGTLTVTGTGTFWKDGSYYKPWNDSKITKLVLDDRITEIPENTFRNWSEDVGLWLTDTLMLPRSLETIGRSAFNGCVGIPSIEIFENLKAIQAYAFEGCVPLASVYYHGSQDQWDATRILRGNTCLTNAELVLTTSPAYKIIYQPNGGEGTMAATTVDVGGTQALTPNAFTRKGYHFIGWSTKADGRIQYEDGQEVSGLSETNGAEVNLYAIWAANIYTAKFLPGTDDYKGTTKDMAKLTNGKTYAAPKCGYTRTGYVFAGWEMEKIYAAGEKFAVSDAENDGTVIFTAQWQPITYTVRFNANKGTGKMSDQKGIPYDESTTLNPCTFTRTGYHFLGWNTKANGTGETVEEALNLTAANKGTVTLYAQWEGEPYDVTFHFGEETRTQTLYYGTAEALDGNPFENPGYTFKCWTSQKNGKGKSYKDGAKVTSLSSGEDVDLYAQWTANKYTVVFHSNLAKDTTKKQTLTYDGKETALTANSFSWKGHAFQGWAEAEDAAEPEYTNKAKVRNLTTEKTIDLYAVWKVNEYTVVFDPNGAEGEEVTQDMTYDVPAELEANRFERRGYTFQGWSTTAKGKAVHVDGKEVKNLTDKDGVTLRLYAVWAPTSYMVSFEPDEGATGTMKPVKMTYGKTYTLTGVSFKRANYTFAGWLNKETLETYANKAKVKNLCADGSTVTLVAQWKPTEYAITYKNLSTWEQEGLPKNYTVLTDGLPGTPSRPGCEFGGWFLDSGCKKPFTGFENTAKPGKLTLYPKWIGTPSKYILHFDPGAENVTGKMADKKNLVCGKDYTLANNAFKRSGYKFVGWEIGSVTLANKAKFSNLPAYLEDFVSGNTITLTAKWVKNTAK